MRCGRWASHAVLFCGRRVSFWLATYFFRSAGAHWSACLSVPESNSEFLLSCDHGLDAVVHVLGELDLVAAESAQVGDVEDAVVGLGVLAVSATDLDVVLVCDGIELCLILAELGQLDVNGGAHAGSQVGGAGGDVTKMLVVGESSFRLDLGGGDGESLEDLADVGALLHGDDTELILLVHPDKESLGVVVEDSTSLWPLTLKTAGFEVLVATLEEEVVGNKLLAVGVVHGGERVVLALEFAIELVKSRDYLLLDLTALLSGDRGTERVIGEVASHADSGRVDHSVLISGEVRALQLGVVHAANVLIRWGVLVIILDDLVEEGSKGVIALVAACVHTDA